MRDKARPWNPTGPKKYLYPVPASMRPKHVFRRWAISSSGVELRAKYKKRSHTSNDIAAHVLENDFGISRLDLSQARQSTAEFWCTEAHLRLIEENIRFPTRGRDETITSLLKGSIIEDLRRRTCCEMIFESSNVASGCRTVSNGWQLVSQRGRQVRVPHVQPQMKAADLQFLVRKPKQL